MNGVGERTLIPDYQKKYGEQRNAAEIEAIYTGKFPNLCGGNLTVVMRGKAWRFPADCLISGGSATIENDNEEKIVTRPWKIRSWPKGFPPQERKRVLDAINKQIEHGCCGGCI